MSHIINSSSNSNELISFEEIRNSICFESNQYFVRYLTDMYAELSLRIPTQEQVGPKGTVPTGITRIIFWEFLDIQKFICEKVFNALDKENKGQLTKNEFVNGLNSLYLGDFEETANFIFSIYDFNNDRKINKADVKLLLSYLPLKESAFEEQMKSLKELDDILDKTFIEGKEELTLPEYKKVITQFKSDSYLQLLLYLYNHKPFTIKTVNIYRNAKRKTSVKPTKKAPSKINLLSPSKNTVFASSEKFFGELEFSSGENNSRTPKPNQREVSSFTMAVQEIEKKKTTKASGFKNNGHDDSKEDSKKTKKPLPSPTSKIKHMLSPLPKKELFSPQGHRKKDSDFVDDFVLCEEDDSPEMKKTDLITMSTGGTSCLEGWIFKYDDMKIGILNRHYAFLSGSDLLFFSSTLKTEFCHFFHLRGAFLDKGKKITYNRHSYHCIVITYSNKTKNNLYFQDEEVRNEWLSYLKESIGNLDFKDHYTVSEILGNGHFGIVQKGKNIKTNQEVAVKVIDKSKLKLKDYELIVRENSIMKLINHTNLVTLIDYFEDENTIYIVMELLEGGDLMDYLGEKKGKISERSAAKIIKKIAEGIKYMNCYGLIHRDLKPENIVFKKKDDISSLKIIDFGLTRTLAFGENASEAMGTIFYIAPEIYTRKPYNNKVDIWSIGVILYLLLSGTLPFDDESQDDNLIGKKVVFSQQEYPSENFGTRSNACIELIDACLEKNPIKRISIDDFLSNSWIINQTKA